VNGVRWKAPRALELADRLIREGAPRPLEEGLRLELEALEEIFRTADAREGLKALLERRRPAFQGR
jgi:enoyl-CoA hydratase/carnithine racemase